MKVRTLGWIPAAHFTASFSLTLIANVAGCGESAKAGSSASEPTRTMLLACSPQHDLNFGVVRQAGRKEPAAAGKLGIEVQGIAVGGKTAFSFSNPQRTGK